MKKFHFFALSAMLLSLGAVEPGLLFESNFNAYQYHAGFAKGKKTGSGLGANDLQLRMYPGPDGKRESNSLSLTRSEFVSYDGKDNISAERGTLMFWLSPINYNLNAAGNFTLLQTPGFQLKLNQTDLQLLYYTGKKLLLHRLNAKEWTPNVWHHVAVTWQKGNAVLFLDGKKLKLKQLALKGVPSQTTSIVLGDTRQPAKQVETFRTAFDELKIYDRVLPDAEIRKEYNRFRADAKAEVPHLVSVPKGERGTEIWLRRPLLEPTHKIDGRVVLRHDGKFLYADFRADVPASVKKHTAHDANLWEDDSFEIHLVSPDRTKYQFIVNGNGCVYDSCNGNVKWSPDGVKATASSDKSSWRASLQVPLAALGKLEGTWLADFTVAQHIGTKTNYYRWSDIVFDDSFTATSHLVFLDTPDFVVPKLGADFAAGKLDLSVDAAANLESSAAYTVPDTPEVKSPIPLKEWKLDLSAGKIQLAIHAKNKGKEIYRYYFDDYIDYPMELSFNTRYAEGKIDLAADFSNAGSAFHQKLAAGIEAKAEMLDPDGKAVVSVTQKVSEIKSAIALPFPKNPVKGNYTLSVTAGGLSRKIPFRMPELTAYHKHLGADHTVPPPWHEVRELELNKRYEILDRIYHFDGISPLPSQMVVKGEKILASAPVLICDGKPVAWHDFRRTRVYPDYVEFTAEGDAGKGKVLFYGQLWFDGMYKMQLKLKADEVSEFRLHAAVPESCGKFVLDPYLLPWEQDAVKVDIRHPGKSRKRAAGLIWLTGHDNGLCFWNFSNADWFNCKERASLEVTRKAGIVTLNARMIDQKAALTRPAQYTLVLQATPPRHPTKNHRQINFCSYGRNSENTHDFGLPPGRTPTSPMMPALQNPEEFDKLYPGRNLRILIYTLPGHLNEWEADMDLWDKNHRNLPGTTHGGVFEGRRWTVWQYCNNATPMPADLWSWWIDEIMAHHPKCGGLYFDVAAVINCENPEHGCGGIDQFGQKFFSSDALGLRNFLLRLYRTIKNRKGDVILHCHVAYVPFVHDFIDSFAPGENTFEAAARNLFWVYNEEIPEEIYQSELNWRKAGVPYSMILQQGRATSIMPGLNKYKKEIMGNPEYAIRSIAAMMIYDLNIWGAGVNYPTINKFWRIRRELKIDDVIDFHGYWVSDAVTSATKKVYCGWYDWPEGAPYRRVIIVSNFNRETVPVALKIDWKKLGVEPVQQCRDLWNDKDLSLDEVLKTNLPGGHFLLLGIQ